MTASEMNLIQQNFKEFQDFTKDSPYFSTIDKAEQACQRYENYHLLHIDSVAELKFITSYSFSTELLLVAVVIDVKKYFLMNNF